MSPEFLLSDTPGGHRTWCPGSQPQPRPYLQGVGGVVDVLDGHVAPIHSALAVGLTQLEGLGLESQNRVGPNPKATPESHGVIPPPF